MFLCGIGQVAIGISLFVTGYRYASLLGVELGVLVIFKVMSSAIHTQHDALGRR